MKGTTKEKVRVKMKRNLVKVKTKRNLERTGKRPKEVQMERLKNSRRLKRETRRNRCLMTFLSQRIASLL